MVDRDEADDAPGAAAEDAARPAAATHRRRRRRAWLLAFIVVLYVFAVPWYRDADAPLRLWLGLPDWVFTALACYTPPQRC